MCPVSYFCICWTAGQSPTHRALADSNFTRRILITEPIFLSTTRSRLRFILCPYSSWSNRRSSAAPFIRPKKLQPGWRDKIALAEGRTRTKASLISKGNAQQEVKQTTHQVTSRLGQINADFTGANRPIAFEVARNRTSQLNVAQAPNWRGFVCAFCLCELSVGFQGPCRHFCLCPAKSRLPDSRDRC